MRIVLRGVAELYPMVVILSGSNITHMEPWYVLPDGGERLIPFRSDVICMGNNEYKTLCAYRFRGVADFYPMVDIFIYMYIYILTYHPYGSLVRLV